MTSKQVLVLTAIISVWQLPANANDIEKVVNKTLGSSKSKLLKQAEGLAKGKLGLSSDKTQGTNSPAGTSTPVAGTVTATPAAPGAAATGAASTAVSGTSPAQTPPASAPTKSLTDKLKHRAQVESSKYAKKYGDRLLQQGEKQVNKILH